jgi:hypothetical protein
MPDEAPALGPGLGRSGLFLTGRFLPRSYDTCFVNAFNWIQSESKKEELVCANEQYYLLRDSCWKRADADSFLQAAVQFWNDW